MVSSENLHNNNTIQEEVNNMSCHIPEMTEYTDSYTLYKRDIGRFPLLTEDQEKELAQQVIEGNTQAKQKLIESNLRLVVSIAQEFISPMHSLSKMDLIQAGNIGLIRAVEKFDIEKGTKFSTYAYNWISSFMRRSIEEEGKTIRIPIYKIQKVKRARNQLELELGVEPTIAQIAEKVGMTEKTIIELISFIKPIISLDVPLYEEDSETVGDLIEGENDNKFEYRIIKQEFYTELKKILTEREFRILVLRYGIGTKKHSAQEVSEQFHISKQAIFQIEQKILKKLQKPDAKEILIHYLEALIDE